MDNKLKMATMIAIMKYKVFHFGMDSELSDDEVKALMILDGTFDIRVANEYVKLSAY